MRPLLIDPAACTAAANAEGNLRWSQPENPPTAVNSTKQSTLVAEAAATMDGAAAASVATANAAAASASTDGATKDVGRTTPEMMDAAAEAAKANAAAASAATSDAATTMTEWENVGKAWMEKYVLSGKGV